MIDPAAPQVDALVEQLEAGGFYINADGARAAVLERRQFNVIETARAIKVDLIVRKARPFSHEEFERRQLVDLPFARGVSVVTPEDAILSKLEWPRKSGDSERQIRDAAGIVDLNPGLDRAHIEKWARELGVSDLWARIA